MFIGGTAVAGLLDTCTLTIDWPNSQTPQCTSSISHNAPIYHRNMHMCVHFGYTWCIVGYLSIALWDLWDEPIDISYGLLIHCDGVSNHQPYNCLLNRLLRRRSKKTSKLRVTGEFPAQMASHAESVSFDDVIMQHERIVSLCCFKTAAITSQHEAVC